MLKKRAKFNTDTEEHQSKFHSLSDSGGFFGHFSVLRYIRFWSQIRGRYFQAVTLSADFCSNNVE